MESQTFTIPFAARLDQGSDPKQLTTGFTELSNCAFDKRGAISKRPGLVKQFGLTNSVPRSDPERLMPVGRALAMQGGEIPFNGQTDSDMGNMSLYSDKLDAWESPNWIQWTSPLYVEREDIAAQLASSLQDGDVAACNGYLVQAWIRKNMVSTLGDYEVVVRVVDELTGTVRDERSYDAISGDQTHTLRALKCTTAASVNIVMVTWINDNQGDPDVVSLRRALINLSTTTPSFGTAGTLRSNVATSVPHYDCMPGPVASDDQQWIVGVEMDDGSCEWRGHNSSSTAVHTYFDSTDLEDVIRPSCVSLSSTQIAIAYFTPGSRELHVVVIDQSAIVSDTTIVTGEAASDAALHSTALVQTDPTDPLETMVVWSFASATPISEVMGWATSDAALIGDVSRVRRLRPYGHPFLHQSRVYICVGDGDDTGAGTTTSFQRRLHWVCLPVAESADSPAFRPYPAAQSQLGLPQSTFAPYGVLRSVSVATVGDEPGKYFACAATQHPTTGTVASDLLQSQQMLVVHFPNTDIARSDFGRAVQIGGQTYVAGGYISQFDDVRFFENGFLQHPGFTAAPIDGAGGTVADGTYLVKIVYEFLDDSDQVAFSSEGTGGTVQSVTTVGNNDLIRVTVEPLTLTLRQQLFYDSRKVLVGVYVSQNDGPYRRTTTFDVTPFVNDPTSLVAQVFDVTTTPDPAAPLLYTNGDTDDRLETDSPPGATTLCAHKGRLWAAGGEDGEVIYYSLEAREGEPISFNLAQFVRISEARIVALVSLDETLFAFSRDAIWRIFGDGPNDTGADGSFTVQKLTSDVGMQWPRCWTLGRDGIYFIGRKGFYLLTRAQTVQYLGAPVETNFASFTDWRAAVVVDSRHEIRFYGRSGVGYGSGFAAFSWVTHNYEQGTWSANSSSAGSAGQLVDAVLYDGEATVITVGDPEELIGPVYQDGTEYRDDGVFYSMVWKTGDLTFGQLQGLKRFRRLSVLFTRSTGGPGLFVGVQVAGRLDITAQPNFWTEEQLDAINPKDRIRQHIRDQKFTAWTVRVADTEPVAAPVWTNAITFSGLSCEVGHIKGVGRASDTASR